MKKYKLYRYILSQSVSLMLLATIIVALIIFMVTGRNVSGFLGLAALNMIYYILNTAKTFKKLADNDIDITKL